MKKIILAIVLIVIVLPLQGQNIFKKKNIKEFRIGGDYGYTQYYGQYSSTFPEYVFSEPDKTFYATPDIRYFQLFAEIKSHKNFIYKLGIGYNEVWEGINVLINEESSAVLNVYSNAGVFLNLNLNMGYSLQYKGIELLPYLGISSNINSGVSDYSTSLKIGDNDIIIGPVVTNQKTPVFFTLDSNLELRFWIKRVGFLLKGEYSKGISKINETYGEYDWRGNRGNLSGYMKGSHLTLSLGGIYRF